MFLREFLCAMIALLAVWGAAGLIYGILTYLIRPKDRYNNVLLLRLRGSAEDAVAYVSYHLSRLSVTGELNHTIIAVIPDCDTPELLKRIADAFGKEQRVVVCTKDSFISRFLL